ncbi:MAG: ABC transporter substrate-binding protein [Actinomycetota bacterium]
MFRADSSRSVHGDTVAPIPPSRVDAFQRRSRLPALLVGALAVATACAGTSGEGEADNAPDGAPSTTVEARPGVNNGTVAPTTAPADPIAGGILRFAPGQVGSTLDPTSTEFNAAERTVTNAVFDTLTAIDVDGRPVPYLAESLEPVFGDLSIWRMTLRRDVVFHDGTPLDAAAVVTNFEAQRADPTVGVIIRADYVDFAPAIAIDERTVEYRLRDQNGAFAARLAGPEGIVASPTWLAATVADPDLRGTPIGTGPFVFTDRTDRFIRVDRNADWWGGDVYLDAIEFITDIDSLGRTAPELLAAGDLDGMQSSDPTVVAELLELGDMTTTVDIADDVALVIVNTQSPPFDDLRARRALTLATPLEAVRSALGGDGAVEATQRFAPDSPYFEPGLRQLGDAPERATPLIAAVCFERPDDCVDGRIAVNLPYPAASTPPAAIDALVEGWSAAGFDVTVEPLDDAAHRSRVGLGAYDATVWQQFGAVDPAIDNVRLFCRNVGAVSLNWSRLCDLDRDAQLLQAQSNTDPETRTPYYRSVSTAMTESYAYVFLTHDEWAYSFAPNVGGVCERTAPDGAALGCTSPSGGTWLTSTWFTG